MGAWGEGIFENDTTCDFELTVKGVLETINATTDGFLERTFSIIVSTEDITNGERISAEKNVNSYLKSVIEKKKNEDLKDNAINFKHFERYKKLVFELLELRDNPSLLIERILKEYDNSKWRSYDRNHYTFAAAELQLEIGTITDYVKEKVLYWVENEKINWFEDSSRLKRKEILNQLKEKVLAN
ncbi:hypothetical protein [Priestia megaterium]|uniref:DUF4259 domain-containing protein n=1 Tax=Priestia megaterium TaxID=1404 RepID=A0A6M6E6L3_PRIMG|nr:hypothetical protein [Priestia megaterium]QJX80779.1 hypothetical protein FDZ14_32325 [Priestia megaterium]